MYKQMEQEIQYPFARGEQFHCLEEEKFDSDCQPVSSASQRLPLRVIVVPERHVLLWKQFVFIWIVLCLHSNG